MPATPLQLMLTLVRARWPYFAGLWTSIVAAASFGVAAQYGMKLIIDAMSTQRDAQTIWLLLALFLGLIATESVFWRLSDRAVGCSVLRSA